MQLAEKVEQSVTPFLSKLAEKYNGELYGLDNRFKTEKSALRKILSHIEDDMQENKDDKEYLNRKVTELKDYLRYTIVLKEENFTDNVNCILNALKENNYELTDLKNRFNDPFYKDISSHYFNDDIIKIRFVFELQFHTKYTLKAKNITHHLYEIVREFESDLRELNESIVKNIYEAIRKLYNEIPIPKDIDEI